MEISSDLLVWIAVLALALVALAKKFHDSKAGKAAAHPADRTASAAASPAHPELDITPVPPGTELKDIEKLQLRPYRPVYHMSMGLKSCSHSDMFPLDHTYESKIALRRQLIKDYPEFTVKSIPESYGAVKEMYEWTIGVYLPGKMPEKFALMDQEEKGGRVMWNKITDEKWPVEAPASTDEALRILCVNIETDLLVMEVISDPESPDKGKYRLTAMATCFPNGLNFAKLVGEPLATIHGPVPKYKEKLEMSMDRFFTKMEPGKVVQRHNWTVTAHQNLFSPGGLKLRDEGDLSNDKKQIEVEAAPECALRVERQTLHRFPKSRAILFGVHTYTYPLKDIKAEGSGEGLATAVEGLFPEMAFFKSRPIWGEAVKSYLRS